MRDSSQENEKTGSECQRSSGARQIRGMPKRLDVILVLVVVLVLVVLVVVVLVVVVVVVVVR